MKKILNSKQLQLADAASMTQQKISSTELMERASTAFCGKFKQLIPDVQSPILICCGLGNNGGDGLAIARLLFNSGYTQLQVWIMQHRSQTTPDFDINLQRLQQLPITIQFIKAEQTQLPNTNCQIIIDAVWGVGLQRSLASPLANWVEQLNALNKQVIAVDMPTGLFADEVQPENALVLKADVCITFHCSKLSLLLPDVAPFVNSHYVVDIGLDHVFLEQCDTPYELTSQAYLKQHFRSRSNFSHKGSFGHALIVAGSVYTMGAALLCTEACIKAGAGLTTAMIPISGLTALNVRIPEAMFLAQEEGATSNKTFSVTAIGPGLGQSDVALQCFKDILSKTDLPCVIDADALNLLAQNPDLFSMIPPQSILTPHLKEFDRMFGLHQNWFERLQTLRKEAQSRQLIIVLKNHHTLIGLPSGKVVFNTTGTPAMASGGAGDVLTGMITAFVAQGYTPKEAAIFGVYQHGHIAQETAKAQQRYVVTPSAIIQKLGIF